jgi:peptide/nickel transport system substrate-binding protein
MDNDSRLLRRAFIEMRELGQFPDNVFQVGDTPLVSIEEARARYNAAIDWIEEFGMTVISNGPYKLVRFEPPAQFAELEAYRDPSYPFKPGDWYKGSPAAIEFESVETAGIGIGFPVTVDVRLQGPGEVEVTYLLLDPVAREVVASGDARRVSATEYAVELSSGITADLAPGLHQLFLVAYSDQVSSLAERRVDIEAVVGEVDQQPRPTPTLSPAHTPTPASTEGGGGFACSGPPLDLSGR